MPNVLAKIVAHKKLEVAALKQQQPISEQFKQQLPASQYDFLAALQQPGPRFILECKKASPSKGLIRAEFNLKQLADAYDQYADCISVLTDEKFFQGKYEYLNTMRGLVEKPLLHKDFIIDSYQIYLGRSCGADAVLLMLSVLDDAEYRELAAVAKSLNMTVLTEVSNSAETLRAVALDANLIGINNRDLRSLHTDLNTSFKLAKLIPNGITIVSESGIHTNQQVRHLSQVADAFLVGSSLMAEHNLDLATRSLVLGEHKICGLTQAEAADAAYAAGAKYGGLIFYPKSPRAVTLTQAIQIQQAAPLCYVGVFVNADITEVVTTAQQLALSAVQLHGDETDAYIQQLRPLLPANCEIWQAYRIKDSLPQFSALVDDSANSLVDRVLLDSFHPSQQGGSGVRFDWNILQQQLPDTPVMLAGGLNTDNVSCALKLAVAGLDFNSGLESAPGIKDPAKIQSTFLQIREFNYE
ncbi:bifunctional indole-3-glycerol phosphate synthase/phosphoribosylanthranilate isomerase [Rheinheimera salexigens]|uniref:Multifunctional fusion protein n=2 Tax=Rheinheimera salexigens TaxID=1628148 RepID=A0A1E7QA68_9GAMM|nr:bifunctional indole-3-glycerol phosphate synthase/phosphoribosylanthranilate isomerase [Rheinheimera salexigens]